MQRQDGTPQTGVSPSLRQRAEARVDPAAADVSRLSPEEVRALVHELQVHQVELEMQNEELLATQADLAKARDRYSDLYDFAPLGYMTLDEEGVVLDANLEAAKLLGISRHDLLQKRFERFVSARDRDACYLALREVVSGGKQRSCEVAVEPQDGKQIYIELIIIPSDGESRSPDTYRVAFFDITNRKEAEAETNRLISELREAASTIRTLRTLLPICSYCKRIRNDDGYWEMIEEYISQHSETSFTHGICPDCLQREFPDTAAHLLDPE